METHDHRPQNTGDEKYDPSQHEGMSRKRATRIAYSPQPETEVKGGHAHKYEEWTRDELYARARQVGIEGRSNMNKEELISALRNH